MRQACSLVIVAMMSCAAATTAAADDHEGQDRLIGCGQAKAPVTITINAHLDASCTYTGGFKIVASDVTLDCRGALVRHTARDGVHAIEVSVGVNSNLENITIRNCHIEGFAHAIDLSRDGANQLPAGHEYDHYLRNVSIVDTTVRDTYQVGIYVHPYVTGTTLRRVTVTVAASTGVYLDEGSRGARIERSVFIGNGFVENGPGGNTTNFAGLVVRHWGPGREGIAVDGSSDNIIRHNWFAGNSAGGVFLYTNCGENVHTDPANWLEHRFGAEHNLIADNVIAGSGTGVWVASRMGENVFPMDCSDAPYVSGPLQSITLDRAPYNTVRGNTIVGADFGVRVEDDHASIISNNFFAPNATEYAVVVGTPYRTAALGEPVSHTVVRQNLSMIAGNPSPYRWVDGVSDLRDFKNVALGNVSSFCKAPDFPRGAFVMVYAFAIQDPSQPPVPPPAYTVPSLGVLPACP